MPENKFLNRFHSTVVCVDSYTDKNLCGRLYNDILESPVEFKSTAEFLLYMLSILNKMDFPKPFLEMRMFSDSLYFDIPVKQTEKTAANKDILSDIITGKMATLSLRVIFCQNSSWQGKISWFDSGAEESFRSVLELIVILDNNLYKKIK